MIPINASKEWMTFYIFNLLTNTFCWVTQETMGEHHIISHDLWNIQQ